MGPRPKIATVERREGSRSHRDRSAPRKRGRRASQARQNERVRLSALHPPLIRVGPAAVATMTGSSPPQRQSTGRSSGDERRDKREKARQGPGTQTCAAGTRSAARHKPRSGLFDIVKTEPERARRASTGLCPPFGAERNRAPVEGFRCKANQPSCDGHHIALAAGPLTSRACWSGGGMRHDCGLDRDLCGAVRPLRGGRERRAFKRLIVHPAAPTLWDRSPAGASAKARR
jgi:hypothetical protein